ncbi:MAG: hypothetical protein JW913_19670 [Chitinispirillaceae bacterium]|nr:hypothetical protein [Chitinispirillaceae bacterium]
MINRELGEALFQIGRQFSRRVQSNRENKLQKLEPRRKVAIEGGMARIDQEKTARKAQEFEQKQAPRATEMNQLNDSNKELSDEQKSQQELGAETTRDIAKYRKPSSIDKKPITFGLTPAGIDHGTVQSSKYTPPSRYEPGQRLGLDQAAGVLPLAKGI